MDVTEQKATLNEVRLNEAFRQAMRRFANGLLAPLSPTIPTETRLP